MVFAAYSQIVQGEKGGIEGEKYVEDIWLFIVISLATFLKV